MILDDSWPVARLIPISSASGVEAQERRAASALLAVVAAVPEFGRALLRPLGAPAGRIQTFIEIPFKLGDHSIRPDGIITVTRAGRTWGAIVETKTAAGHLTTEQMETYLDLARELEFEAVLSISNHYVTSSAEYPIEVDRRKLRKVSLHHWSWIDVLTEAVVQREFRGISDPDQAYILGELIRYLSDPRSGAVSFEGMGQHWTAVRDGAREQTLRKGDPKVAAIAARWDDLVRYLALDLTKELGRDVKQVLPPSERTPSARRDALVASLADGGRLGAELQVPNVAGPLLLIADLRARQLIVSTHIDAPKEGRSKGRVSWLLRQLQNAPESLKVEAKVTRSSNTLAATLGDVRERPELLYPEGGRDIRQFVLSMSTNMGMKRDNGRGSFVDSVIAAVETFYREVLQNLRAWKAPPPKLKKPAEGEDVPAALPEALSEVLDVPETAIDGDSAGATRPVEELRSESWA
jgi:hypothetical protein